MMMILAKLLGPLVVLQTYPFWQRPLSYLWVVPSLRVPSQFSPVAQ